jgi:hypothetical protein
MSALVEMNLMVYVIIVKQEISIAVKQHYKIHTGQVRNSSNNSNIEHRGNERKEEGTISRERPLLE